MIFEVFVYFQAQQTEELKKLRAETNEVKKLHEGLAIKLKEKETLLVKMMNEQAIDSDEIAVLKQQLEDTQTRFPLSLLLRFEKVGRMC